MNYTKRIYHLREFLKQQNLDAVFITSPANLIYYSGFQPLDITDREAYLLITRHHAYILTSPLYAAEVKKYVKDFELKETSGEYPLLHVLEDIAQKENLQIIGFEEYNLLYSEYQKFIPLVKKFLPISINHLRIHKDQEELVNIKKACEIGDHAFDFVLGKIKPGITERELAFQLELFMRKQYTLPSFPTIVAFGANAAIPHHVTNDQKLTNNNFVLMDFGVKYNNYCSDMSRTIFAGTPSSEQKKMYQAVLESQQLAIEYMINKKNPPVEGTKGWVFYDIKAADVDHIARNHLIEQGYPSFPHSLGHGIGIQVHEQPGVSPHSHDLLQEGMVFSVEPGMYVPDSFGIRIEDLIAIEKNEVTLLTKAPKELIII